MLLRKSAALLLALLVALGVSSPAQAAIDPPSLPGGTVGSAYSQNLTASGGAAPYAWSVTAGALPPGLSLSPGGVVGGTPTGGGSFGFTITATDSESGTQTQSYTLDIDAPTIALSPTTLPGSTVGQAYSQTLTASGGTAPHSYTVTAGALPAGLSLNATGTLSGTPTSGGTFNFTATATDSSGGSGPYSGSRAYTLTVAGPTITVSPATLPNATAGTAYSQTVTAAGGTAPYSFAVTAGALPAGLSLSSAGTISGTPTAVGTFVATVSAIDASSGAGAPYSGSRTYSLTVGSPTITVSPSTLPAATAGTAYSQTITSSGGTAPYSYNISSGTLPPGVTLSASGTLAGTPTVGGSFTFTVRAVDSSSTPSSGARSYTLLVSAPTIVVSPTTVPNAAIGSQYAQTVTASGGTGPYSFAVTAGALPAGVTLSAGGSLSGTPTAGGSFGFTVTATDSAGFTGSRAYSLIVNAPTMTIAPATLPAASAGTAYSQTLTASGGTAPYTFTVTAGALPPGLSVTSAGVLSGTPTVAGTFTFTAQATDSSTGSGPFVATRSYSLTVAAPTITVAPATLPDATTGSAYSQTITATGGTGPHTFAVTAGALPAGLSLSAAGALTGTPTASGAFNVTITATDASGFIGSRAYALTVGPSTISIAPATLPDGTFETAYSQTLTGSGGTPPYTFSVTAGALPAGLSLSPTGVLSGIPSVAGSFSFTVRALDSTTGNGPDAGTRAYVLTIAAPTLVVSPTTLPDADVAAAYDQTLTTSGGTGPYDYAVTGGALPAGLSLSSAGVLSGTPTAGGTFAFTVTSTDASDFTGSRAYTLAVDAPTVVVDDTPPPAGTVGDAYSFTVSASGGTAPYTFELTGGFLPFADASALAVAGLPAGLTLAPDGTISGTPTQAGTFEATVTATDSSTGAGPYSGSRTLTFTIAAAAADPDDDDDDDASGTRDGALPDTGTHADLAGLAGLLLLMSGGVVLVRRRGLRA